ncbi:hypothetical protein ACLUEY_17740 [Vreelandella aquamarina]
MTSVTAVAPALNASFSPCSPFVDADSQARSAFGLVPSTTSDTAPDERHEIDRVQSRLSRMSKGVKTGARLHSEESQKGGFRHFIAMVTLTYSPDCRYSKRHISDFLKRVREWHRRRSLRMRYVWVLELTKAGVPHYHVLFWVPRGHRLPKPDSIGWWSYGSTKIEGARKPVGYLAKYASKLADGAQGELKKVFKGLPKGARLHGCGGLSEASARERRWWLSPTWVRRAWPVSDDPRPSPGGGWASRVTGTWLSSPYRVVLEGSRVFIVPRAYGPEWLDFFGLGASSSSTRSGGLLDASEVIQALEKYNQGGERYAA